MLFSAFYLVHPSILFDSSFCSLFCFLPLFIHFVFWSPLLFSFQISYPFFSFLFSYYSVLSASPLFSITIQYVLFLLEPSIWYFFAISFALASDFFMLLLFGKDLMTLPVLCSYLFLFSFPIYCLSLSVFLFALLFTLFSLLLYSFLFLFSSLLVLICCSCSYCLFFSIFWSPLFSFIFIFIYFQFFSFLLFLLFS